MKKNTTKKIICALILSLSLTNAHAYTYAEVSEACNNAHDTIREVGTCIYNICSYYGCGPSLAG